jgi:hypothetical protein
MKDQTSPPEHRSIRLRLAAALLILAVTAFRLLYLFCFCPYDLAPDEAHYWDWSRHLDWSYYSKGPLVAWMIRGACEAFGDAALTADGTLMPAVRAPAVLFGAGLLAGLYVLTWQTYRNDRLAFGIVVCAVTFPAVTAASLLMTIDSPFLCSWVWALVFGRSALVDGHWWAWPAAGAFVALGILAKYTMALWLVSAALFVLSSPSHRRMLLRPGFWVMCLTAGLSALPILYWNAEHDWVTFRHVAVQAGVQADEREVRWLGPVEYVAGQFLLLLGFWFVAWVLAVIRFRPRAGAPAGLSYLWWMSVPTFVLFAMSTLRARGQLNWPVAAYLSGAVLVAGWLVEALRSDRGRAVRRAFGLSVCLGALVTVLMHDTRLLTAPVCRLAPAWLFPPDSTDRPTPLRAIDPAARLKGARFLGTELDRLRAELGRADGSDPVLAGMRWDIPGLVGFYSAGRPHAYSVGLTVGADRHSQYDLWRPNPVDDPDAFRGRTFLIVAGWDAGPSLVPAFDDVSPPVEIVYRENGRALARWYVCVCRGFRGFDRAVNDAEARPGY